MEDNTENIFEYTSVFGGWKIENKIGSGSFGTVYKVYKEGLKGTRIFSAVKVMSVPTPEQLQDAKISGGLEENELKTYFEGYLEDLLEEIRLFERLSNDSNCNILTYHDSEIISKKDAFGWDVLIRMEYATPFDKYILGKELTLSEVIKLGIDMLNALETCHSNNIIHRDIKDSNIFVSKSGKFKLGDFGVARELTISGYASSVKGSLGYIAPEIYKGSKEYSKNVDIYSLGIVLYRLLNHFRFPFLPNYPAPITHKDADDAFEKRISGMKLSKPLYACPEFTKIILKACEFDPKLRYQSAIEMKNDMLKLLNKKTKEELTTPITSYYDPNKITLYSSTKKQIHATIYEKTSPFNEAKNHKTSKLPKTDNNTPKYFSGNFAGNSNPYNINAGKNLFSPPKKKRKKTLVALFTTVAIIVNLLIFRNNIISGLERFYNQFYNGKNFSQNSQPVDTNTKISPSVAVLEPKENEKVPAGGNISNNDYLLNIETNQQLITVTISPTDSKTNENTPTPNESGNILSSPTPTAIPTKKPDISTNPSPTGIPSKPLTTVTPNSDHNSENKNKPVAEISKSSSFD